MRQGFTLIELMVVLVVMATLAAAITPSVVSAMRRRGVPTAANRLADLFDFASATAISRRRPVTVNIDPARRVCWAVVEQVSLPWMAEHEVEVRTLTALQLPETVAVSLRDGPSAGSQLAGPGMETIRFEPDGTAPEVAVELRGPDGQMAVVEIMPGSGQVRVTVEG